MSRNHKLRRSVELPGDRPDSRPPAQKRNPRTRVTPASDNGRSSGGARESQERTPPDSSLQYGCISSVRSGPSSARQTSLDNPSREVRQQKMWSSLLV